MWNVHDAFRPGFIATGIGTLPHTDVEEAVEDVLSSLPAMPYWPQLPALGNQEDMNLQYGWPLRPLVEADLGERSLRPYPGLSREAALAAFYERLLGKQASSFGIRPEDSASFFAFCQAVRKAPAAGFSWVKGHVTGPLTLSASVLGDDGKALLYDDEVAEAIAGGLGAAAAAQAEQLASLGRKVMIFLDEPFLDGYGSAFTPIQRERVVELLARCMEEARNRAEMKLGIHCCGNTDWSMLVDAGADVINLDSAGYGENILLYPEAVATLLRRGGAVAWGAVPTIGFNGDETGPGLWSALQLLLQRFEENGVDRELLASQAMVTPACGMGSLTREKARRILELTHEVSILARQEYTPD